MSKLPGPSRIPTFGTRIPQSGPVPKRKQEGECTVCSTDVGKKVVTAGKIGTLRFVGNVHFASGVWCGIELETDVGKNDGCIDGRKYFSSSDGHGLMTPLSKVSILNKRGKCLSESRSQDSVATATTEESISTNKNKLIFDIKENNSTPIVRQERIEFRLPLADRENTLDVNEKKNLLNNKCVNNATSSGTVNNNNKAKQNSLSTPVSENVFHNTLEGNIQTAKYKSMSRLSTNYGQNNGNSLLLVETISKTGFKEIKTCEELYEKNISKQSNDKSQKRCDKLFETCNETVDSSNSDALVKSNHISEGKERFKRETIFNRLSSSSTDERDSLEGQTVKGLMFNTTQEDENKRDSLDLDESLEILTASQMNDGFSTADPFFSLDAMQSEQKQSCQSPLQNSNFEFIFQDNTPIISDTTLNLELTVDTLEKSKNFGFARLEETPSPEELPLDPIPIVVGEPKCHTAKCKTNSFITSITSITSLDTGYQGDGEMSRPGSRGADNSPLTRRPLQRPPPRRTDAMTDSDFFTESDADNHDENVLRGDRKAQVIDGTLYGVDAQAAADMYMNNRENMDSSGIFTDIESNTRTEESTMDEKIDISPTDTSSKTLSENSQNNLNEIIAKNLANSEVKLNENKGDKSNRHGNVSPAVSNNSSTASPRHAQIDDAAKKHKTLKREVQSKVKVLLETNVSVPEKKTLKKSAGRWDAVMNKISKSDSKTNFHEVKSRVFNGMNSSPNSASNLKNQSSLRPVNNLKQSNNKLRRVRTRILSSPHPSKNSNGESIHSSLSDISASLPKKTIASVKKREVQQVTQVLTAKKLSPKLSQPAIPDGKRRAPTSTYENKTPRKAGLSPKEKKQIANKENGKNVVKGRTSPVVKSPAPNRAASKPVPRTTEALAVLVHHLVFNVEAFEVPHLRRQVKKFQHEAIEIRSACHRLEEQLTEEKQKNCILTEEERSRWREDVAQLIESHHNQISQAIQQRKESEEALINEHECSKAELKLQYEQKLCAFKREFEKLQKTHEESLDILREENDAIREDIDAKNEEIRDAKHESIKLKQDYEAKECVLKEQIQVLSRENQKIKQEMIIYKGEILKLEEEQIRLVEDNKRLLSYGEGKGIGVQEVESLRAVLELKQTEVADLRKCLAEVTQKADLLANCEEKAAALQARCEDLQLQLQRKADYEMMLISENKRLEQSIQEEAIQRRNLSLRNEELQWKLKQDKEVISKILEKANDEAFNRSEHSPTSFNNDRYNSNTSLNHSFKSFTPIGRSSICTEGAKKLRKSQSLVEDDSPPPSPKVKGVVEKSDSVSYVLDLDESPDVVASRLVRRSFRNSSNQKNTPTKSPCNKRPRVKNNPLSQSSSASSIISNNKMEYNRSRSVSVRNSDEDFQDDIVYTDNSCSPSPCNYPNLKLDESAECPKHDDLDYMDDNFLDLTLPALPNELGCQIGIQSLPMPRHLAGEAMVSESNSDDESTSSSSGQL